MTRRSPPSSRLRRALLLACALPLAAGVPCLAAPMTEAELVDTFGPPAAQVFRGRCSAAEPVEVRVGQVSLAATEWTFEVSEWLRGGGPPVVRFRQLGRPQGGRDDLGRLAGLPVYEVGAEYVLFLLPPGRLGLTSPAGAGEAALSVAGDSLHWVAAGHGWTRREESGAGVEKSARQAAGTLRLAALREALRGSKTP
jgi:hypothetical protein